MSNEEKNKFKELIAVDELERKKNAEILDTKLRQQDEYEVVKLY